MRVLTIGNLYPPHAYGGYELLCADAVAALRGAGHDVHVLTSNARVAGVSVAASGRDDVGVTRTLLPYWDWARNVEAIPRRLRHVAGIERSNLRELRAALARVRPDVVSVWHMAGLSLSLLTELEKRGLPVLITFGNDWLRFAPSLDGWLRRTARWPSSSLLGLPTRPPTLAGMTADFMSRSTMEANLATGSWQFADTVVAYPGVNTGDFPIVDAGTDRPWSWRVLYVGRLDPNKGIETLLPAFAALPPAATLTIAGGGGDDYAFHLKRLATDLGIRDRVTFTALGRRELRSTYAAADVVVFPSTWDEPFGVVPLEAMACSVPVVATGTGGSGEYLTHEVNCLRFAPFDVDGLRAALARLAADPALRARLRTGGARTAGELTAQRYGAQLVDLHEHVARRARG